MSRENSNARVDNISTKHVEINEKTLRRCLELLCRNWQFTRHDSIKNLLLAAIRDARKCKNVKPKLQPSYTVPPRPRPRTSIVRQKTAVSRMLSEDHPAGNEASEYFDTASSSKVHQSPKRPQSAQNRQQTPQKQLQTPQKVTSKSHYDLQTPQSAQPEHSSTRQDASGTPNAFLGISRLQQGTVPTSTPFKSGAAKQKNPELSFQVILPSKHDQSQMRRIQCDHNLSIDDYERIIDIVESFTDVDNLSNSLITVSKRNLSQIVPGKYDLMRAV
ncbi:unnamed protein product [Chironomus riparius]|uniref:Uncharacterized protein n=1 Tax=Chironomus riparius TaxID=315576 RepID=A0A9N9WNX9_9DIPT|nr:unnamed protein product [Chironomus riparius]